MQADILDRGPDNRQATGLGREHIDLISPLSHIAEETFNGVGRPNVPVHGLRELIKRERLLFLLSQASYCLWIALTVFGECSPSIVSMPPAWLVAPRCPRVRPEPHLALAWGWHSRHCVVCALDSADEG